MNDFVKNQLHPTENCLICSDTFSSDHCPVTLPCQHIFGYPCIKRWLLDGRGKNNACPHCRHVLVKKQDVRLNFDAASIWQSLCEQPPERLHSLMLKMWSGLRSLWKRSPTGKFTVTELLDHVIIPALIQMSSADNRRGSQQTDPMFDCYNMIAACWDSLGRPDTAVGMAIPLVRLARLVSSASGIFPMWLTTVPRMNQLCWKANACMQITEPEITWAVIIEAAASMSTKNNQRYMPILHVYTILLSQSILHDPQPASWPLRRHEIMNLVVERCCTKIGGDTWVGRPSNKFKDMLVIVYEELRRFHLEKKKPSLRGYEEEETVVKGIWALAGWGTESRN